MRLLLLFALLATAHATCSNQIQIRHDNTGSWPQEISIEVNGVVIVAESGFSSFTQSACFDIAPAPEIKLKDSYGDGWSGNSIVIVYIDADGNEVKYEDSTTLSGSEEVITWCPDGVNCYGCDTDEFYLLGDNGGCVTECPSIPGATVPRSTPGEQTDNCNRDNVCTDIGKVLHDVDGCVDACPVEEGNYTFSLVNTEIITMSSMQHVNVVTSGANTNWLTLGDCKIYQIENDMLWTTFSTNVRPAGCFVEGTRVYYNTNEGSTYACSETHRCLQSNAAHLNEQECQQYAQDVGRDYVTRDSYTYPDGCSVATKVVYNAYEWSTTTSSNPSCDSYGYICIRRRTFPQPQCSGEKECVNEGDEFVLSSTDTCVAECPLTNGYRHARSTPDADTDACDGEKICDESGEFVLSSTDTCVAACPLTNGYRHARSTPNANSDACDGEKICDESGEFIYNNTCVAACPTINGISKTRGTIGNGVDNCDGPESCEDSDKFIYNGACVSICPGGKAGEYDVRSTTGSGVDTCDGPKRCIDVGKFVFNDTCVSECPTHSASEKEYLRSNEGGLSDDCGIERCKDLSKFIYSHTDTDECISECPIAGNEIQQYARSTPSANSDNCEGELTCIHGLQVVNGVTLCNEAPVIVDNLSCSELDEISNNLSCQHSIQRTDCTGLRSTFNEQSCCSI